MKNKPKKTGEWDEPFWMAYHLFDEDYEETMKWFDTSNMKMGGVKPSKLLLSPEGRMKLLEFFDNLKNFTLSSK